MSPSSWRKSSRGVVISDMPILPVACPAPCTRVTRFVTSSDAAPQVPGAAAPGIPGDVSQTPTETFPALIETMKKAAAALEAAGVPVLLGGGLAAWARGGP